MEEKYQNYFNEYNKRFFDGRLNKIELIWSERLKSTAGVFYPDKKNPKEAGRICLNRRLLQNRSEKEILETLLHEMTHAYLEPLSGIKPHGKEFQDKILQLNIALDLDITVSHSFVTWWRCDGKCKKQALFNYGYASGIDEDHIFRKNPKSVEVHKKFCGGTFHKTCEPNSEILSELKRLKRKRKSVKNQEIHCTEGIENSTSRLDTKRRFTRYSSDGEN